MTEGFECMPGLFMACSVTVSFPLRIQNISFQLACVANHLIPEITATFVLFAAVISYADMKSSEVMILAVINADI